MSTKKEFGDFQTPERLARRCVALVAEIFGTPDFVVEPTAGLGSFLTASASRWGRKAEYEGYELHAKYVEAARANLSTFDARILQRDFFTENWKHNLSRSGKRRVLVIGNPPWVTNSELGQLGSDNLPTKTNFQGLRGFDARTGKSNFDISEWMLVQLIEALPEDGAIAMLCKTMTARKVLRHFWKTKGGLRDSSLFRIDAKAEFDVAVDACLFFALGERTSDRVATIYADLDTASATTRFGLVDGVLVADLDAYETHKGLSGGSSAYTWRSGIKHDAGSVMEFSVKGDQLINGLGEVVEIEDDYVFPLLKSSDLGNGRVTIRKAVLVTQRHTGDTTAEIRRTAPKTWAYLTQHAAVLEDRKSSIYENRPKFSVFGIGPYSFAPWKVAVSGLYKDISFVIVPPDGERPVMVDDTCYFIPCKTQEEAELLFEMLVSGPAKAFLNSLIFRDSKRPITADVLRKLSIVELARVLGKLSILDRVRGEKATAEAGLFAHLDPV
ncbi:MAG TPA: hypothetical protein VGR35_14770 [Tepidisphaeraceae bacterium]|nr:hypothetical protein [Tepidisphaeraceae bacterium]